MEINPKVTYIDTLLALIELSPIYPYKILKVGNSIEELLEYTDLMHKEIAH